MATITDTEREVDDRGVDEYKKAQDRDYIQAKTIEDFSDPERFALLVDLTDLIAKRRKFQTIFKNPETGPASKLAAAKALINFHQFLHKKEIESTPGNGRDKNGVLVFKSQYKGIVPWDANNAKRLEDIEPFSEQNVLDWNFYVRQNSVPLKKAKAGGKRADIKPVADKRAGKADHSRESKDQIKSGIGIDSQGIMTIMILKTPEMSTKTEVWKKYLMLAVIKKLYPELSDDRIVLLVQNLSDNMVNVTDKYPLIPSGTQFPIQVDQNFLKDVTKLMPLSDDELYRRAEERIRKSGLLWKPIRENESLEKRMMYAIGRIMKARRMYNFSEILYKPGKIYSGNQLFVDYAGTIDEQIWMLPDGRLFQVNERALQLEAFRQGVLSAENAVTAMGFIAIAVTTVILLAPLAPAAVSEMPVAAQSLYLAAANNPITTLAVAEVGLGTLMQIDEAGGFGNFLESLKDPRTAWMFFYSLLDVYHARLSDLQKPKNPGDPDAAKAKTGLQGPAESPVAKKPANPTPSQPNGDPRGLDIHTNGISDTNRGIRTGSDRQYNIDNPAVGVRRSKGQIVEEPSIPAKLKQGRKPDIFKGRTVPTASHNPLPEDNPKDFFGGAGSRGGKKGKGEKGLSALENDSADTENAKPDKKEEGTADKLAGLGNRVVSDEESEDVKQKPRKGEQTSIPEEGGVVAIKIKGRTVDLNETGALTHIANYIKAMGKRPFRGVVEIVWAVKNGKRFLLAGLNSSAAWSDAQLEELKRLGIQVAPQRYRGEMEGKDFHAEENMATYLKNIGATGIRWSKARVGDVKRGRTYVCDVCRSLIKLVGGTIE